MNWTYEEIRKDWLGCSQISAEPKDVVQAFDRCERLLGRDWLERARDFGKLRGSSPTLRVVSMGLYLASLDGVNSEQLIKKIQAGDFSAEAELRAIHLLRSAGRTRFELEPTTTGDRKCDFRIKREQGPWVYVEVTQPDTSEAQSRVDKALETISDVVTVIKRSFGLEVFFRRELADEEIPAVLNAITRLCSADHSAEPEVQEEMPNGMGLLILSTRNPGLIVIHDHGGPNVPRLSQAKTIFGTAEPYRHVQVRMPFADERADDFLRKEVRQLPNDAPTLIMVEMSRAPGGFRSWEPILERRFQPTVHTRVGGMSLFTSWSMPTDRGEVISFHSKLITNSHAAVALPPWVEQTLKAAGER